MIPSWRSLLSWKPIRMGNLRRLADYIEPEEIIDLAEDDAAEPEEEASEVPPSYKCPICLAALQVPVATVCGHVFCLECLALYLPSFKMCPLCKRVGTKIIRLYF